VTHGRGFAHTRGAATVALTADDIVYVPPGEERWNGAATDTMLVHVVVSPG
jgi:quercetin dioxygenase-like cupin family protein